MTIQLAIRLPTIFPWIMISNNRCSWCLFKCSKYSSFFVFTLFSTSISLLMFSIAQSISSIDQIFFLSTVKQGLPKTFFLLFILRLDCPNWRHFFEIICLSVCQSTSIALIQPQPPLHDFLPPSVLMIPSTFDLQYVLSYFLFIYFSLYFHTRKNLTWSSSFFVVFPVVSKHCFS